MLFPFLQSDPRMIAVLVLSGHQVDGSDGLKLIKALMPNVSHDSHSICTRHSIQGAGDHTSGPREIVPYVDGRCRRANYHNCRHSPH